MGKSWEKGWKNVGIKLGKVGEKKLEKLKKSWKKVGKNMEKSWGKVGKGLGIVGFFL